MYNNILQKKKKKKKEKSMESFVNFTNVLKLTHIYGILCA